MGQELNIINNRQIIIYLAEKFPNCFVINGESRPLKLGIFQDIVEALKEELPVSKTQLRAALRSYTSSYSYLESVKLENRRVDLTGQPCEEMTESHVVYAQQIIAERKAKREISLKKKAMALKQSKQASTVGNKVASKPKPPLATKSHKVAPSPKRPKLDLTQLKVDQKVQIAVGKSRFNATILEILDITVRVQLATGLTMTVNKSVLQ